MKKAEKGVTIVELLIYMVLLTGFLLVLTDIFVSSLNVQTTSESNTAVQIDGEYILARLVYDAGQAQDITTPATLGQTTNSLVFSEGGKSHNYTLNNGVLSLAVNGVTNSLNSYGSNVASFSATKIGSSGGKPTAQVIFTLKGIAVPAQGPEQRTFQITLGVR